MVWGEPGCLAPLHRVQVRKHGHSVRPTTNHGIERSRILEQQHKLAALGVRRCVIQSVHIYFRVNITRMGRKFKQPKKTGKLPSLASC